MTKFEPISSPTWVSELYQRVIAPYLEEEKAKEEKDAISSISGH